MQTPIQDARLALELIDLTSLNTSDTAASIAKLCAQAKNSPIAPAALCIYPAFIGTARERLQQLELADLKIATVTNFPHGTADLDRALADTEVALAHGAQEIDLVLPYPSLKAGDDDSASKLVRACKSLLPDGVLLKVIIESGELQTPALIRRASELAIDAGADFLKTSTGKVPVNATLAAAEIMLTVIKESGTEVGFKAAGGVKTAAQAASYLQLARKLMGASWPSPRTFRFGASSLMGDLLAVCGQQAEPAANLDY